MSCREDEGQYGGHGWKKSRTTQTREYHPRESPFHRGYSGHGTTFCIALGRTLISAIQAISDRRGCSIKIEETWRLKHTAFEKKLVRMILKTADQARIPFAWDGEWSWTRRQLHEPSGADGNDLCSRLGDGANVEVEKTKWERLRSGCECSSPLHFRDRPWKTELPSP